MKLSRTRIHSNIVLYYDPNDEFIGKVIARTGTYEPFESKMILQRIKEGNQVVDVGANIGYYSLVMAKKVGPKGVVYAFEPEPKNFSILQKNVLVNNFNNVEAFPVALSSKKEVKKLFLSKSNPGDHQLFNSRDKKFPCKHIAVTADALDNILKMNKNYQKITLMKIDTQGYEPFVITGASQTIKKDRPMLFMEYSPDAYKRAGADEKKMISFLKKSYGAIHLVDNRYGAIYLTSDSYIKNYCQQVKSRQYCDLFFRKINIFEKLKNYIIRKTKDCLNLPYRINKPITFGIGGNADYYKEKGWSYSEKDFTWTEGKNCKLKIPLSKSFNKLELHILARPFLSKKTPYQKLAIYVNNKKVFNKKLSNQKYVTYKIKIPNLFSKKCLNISFKTPDSVSPYCIRVSEDKRVLGFAIKEITLSRF